MAETESRVKKSILNARVNLIFYFIIVVLSFFSRKIFLDSLGADFVGFTGTLQNLLGFLNLAELGIATAIGYVLYKPLFDHDQQKINEIVSVLGYLYRWIGIIILGAGVILSAFLPLIFPETGFDIALIYFAYYSFLASTLIGYFINYRQNLLGADQKNYVVVGYFQTANIIKTLIQMVSAYYTGSYYLWVAIELIFGIGYSFVLNWKIDQTYPWLKTEFKEGHRLFQKYPEVIRYTKQLFFQKLSGTVQWWSVPFLTYVFASLSTVAYYGNYTIITDKLAQFVNTFFESTSAGVGNLIAEGNIDKIKHVFWELMSIRFYIGAIFAFSIYMLIEPFIALWIGEQYILPKIVLCLIVLNIFISYTRGGIMQFLFGFGLFYDIWASIAESVINILVACVCGYFYGLPGVLMGGITSQIIIINIWKPYFLFSCGFKESVWHYWTKLFIMLCTIITPMIAISFLAQELPDMFQPTSWLSWVFYSGIIFILYSIITFGLMFAIMGEFRSFTYRFLKNSTT